MSVSPRVSEVSQHIDIVVYLQQEVSLDVWAVELLGAHGPGKFLGEFSVQDIFVVPHRELRKLLQGGARVRESQLALHKVGVETISARVLDGGKFRDTAAAALALLLSFC